MVRLLVFVAGVVGVGFLIGATNLPGAWYASLAKPGFVPPNWVFPVAWTILYIMIAVAGWRTFRRDPSGKAMLVWFAQLALNFAWSIVFFGMHQLFWALVVILALLASIIMNMVWFSRFSRTGAWLLLPYLLWVSFASVLNLNIYLLNR